MTNSSLGSNRPNPGLTLESLSFKNFPRHFYNIKKIKKIK